MLLCILALDCLNYSRYQSLFWCEMVALKETNADVYFQLESGDFCFQRSYSNFSQVAVDQAIEQTVNKDTKTRGGIVSFSRSPASVHKWMINAHFRTDVTRSVKQMAGLTGRDKYVHKECSQTVLASKEASVKSVMQTINSWQDPFDSPFDASVNLVSLSSGVTASDEVKVDLLQSYSSGEQQFLQFVQQRLVSSTKNFFDPLPKLKLKTFTTLVRKKSIQVRG